MKFVVLSRKNIEDLAFHPERLKLLELPPTNITNANKRFFAIISIYSTGDKPAKLPITNNCRGAIRLEFDDISKSIPNCSKELTLFNEDLAKRIINFYNKIKNKIDYVLVNCDAGISRSSAVAAALAKISGQDDSEFFKKYLPNMYVYNKILEVYYREVEND